MSKRRRKILKPEAKAKSQEDLENAYNDNVVAFPSEGSMPVPRQGSELEHNWKDNNGSRVDILGRVDGKTYPSLDDDIPDFLKESAMKKPPENVQEHAVPVTTRTVKLMKDHTLDYPLLGLSIYVMGDPDVKDDEARFARMFARAYCKGARNVEEADMVIFGGGSDVNPRLYGEERHETTFFCSDRDDEDMLVYNYCTERGIPMLGICRGAQFGSVMHKGKLYQNVDRHYGDHPMWDIKSGRHLEKVSSVHHQMVMPNIDNGMTLIATAARSTKRQTMSGRTEVTEHGTNADIEAFFYRDNCFLGIQGHPEYEGYNFYTVWCLGLVMDYVYNNPDLNWIDGKLRMKPELIQERNALANLPKPAQELLIAELKGL